MKLSKDIKWMKKYWTKSGKEKKIVQSSMYFIQTISKWGDSLLLLKPEHTVNVAILTFL